jgi:putative endonuclease
MTPPLAKNPPWADVSPHSLGRKGEKIALNLLQKKKFQIREKGFRMFRGEIDIIADDGDDLVFIEVKSRRGNQFGHPEDSVTPAKQRQIKKIAAGYLFKHDIQDKPCRFDVIAITFFENKVDLIHFEDAF